MEERTYAKECGLRCSRLRMAQGMSQQELADKVFTTAQNISKYEKNGISNIDMIRKISDALGQDLLVDEIDTEGTVGEIGKEILWKLIEGCGHKAVEELVREDMYGMSMSRVNQEIFKLERIGMCVREQYTDFDDETKDMLFITAKGLITYKSLVGRSVLNTSETETIRKAVSYEKLLGGAENYQEFVNQREAEKLIRSIKGDDYGEYRVNFIHYLKSNFEKGIGKDKNRINHYFENLIPEQGFYHDLIFRMALHYDTDWYNELLLGLTYDPKKEKEMMELEEKYIGTPCDTVKSKTETLFKKEFPIIEEVEITDEGLLDNGGLTEEQEALEPILRPYWEDEQRIEECYENPRAVFSRSLREGHTTPYPTRWFTDEEIRTFIVENLHAARTDAEKELDVILEKICELEPTARLYYQFPQDWETNGLADLVRNMYGLPAPGM